MSSHLISKSFGPDCQDVREKMLHNRKKEKSSEKEKERLNELCSRNAFPPVNSAVFLGVLCFYQLLTQVHIEQEVHDIYKSQANLVVCPV